MTTLSTNFSVSTVRTRRPTRGKLKPFKPCVALLFGKFQYMFLIRTKYRASSLLLTYLCDWKRNEGTNSGIKRVSTGTERRIEKFMSLSMISFSIRSECRKRHDLRRTNIMRVKKFSSWQGRKSGRTRRVGGVRIWKKMSWVMILRRESGLDLLLPPF